MKTPSNSSSVCSIPSTYLGTQNTVLSSRYWGQSGKRPEMGVTEQSRVRLAALPSRGSQSLHIAHGIPAGLYRADPRKALGTQLGAR